MLAPTKMKMDDDAAEAMADGLDRITRSLDFVWLFVNTVLVILMQAAFAAYEVGSIRTTTSSSILKKNLGDASISLCAWILVGYAIANGEDKGRVAGGTYFAFWQGQPFEATDDSDSGLLFLECVFRWSFAATCTTIVSGAVADRIYVKAYFIYAFFTSALFYPLVAHAVWTDEGWASPLKTSRGEPDAFFDCGVIDFAGSGVVHMLGGGISLVMAKMVKNRPDRFIEANKERAAARARPSFTFFKRFKGAGAADPPSRIVNLTGFPQLNENAFRANDPSWMTLGCFLMWLGWYGFNLGSVLQISTEAKRNTAGRAALNTTIGAAVGCISSMVLEVMYHRCSPKYRREKYINDPFEEDPFLKDPFELNTEDDYNYEEDHKSGFKWRLSTHKDIHGAGCNGVLAGLVGITAGCATMDPWPAIGVSFVSALVYHVSYRVIICCKIDDAVNATAVHLFGGLWGLIAAGFTVTSAARTDLGYPTEEDGCTWVNQARANAAMAAIILGYSLACGGILWILFIGVGISGKAMQDNQLKKQMDPDVYELRKRLARQVGYLHGRLIDLEKSEVDSEAKIPSDGSQRYGRMTEHEESDYGDEFKVP